MMRHGAWGGGGAQGGRDLVSLPVAGQSEAFGIQIPVVALWKGPPS